MLGKGASKSVYKGFDTETGCQIAWATVNTSITRKSRLIITSEEVKRVSDEIELLKKLSHPNIISLKGSWEDKEKSQIVLITDLASGGNLSQ